MQHFMSDLYIAKTGVLRTELEVHQEHLVDQNAQAGDRNKVPAAVINVPSDSDSEKDESIIATSDSEESGSEPASSLASDSEQYELIQTAYATVGRDFVVVLYTSSACGKNHSQPPSSPSWRHLATLCAGHKPRNTNIFHRLLSRQEHRDL